MATNDGEPVGGEMGERIPELAAGDRIDARGGLVEKQHARLRHQRAGQRELLFHAAAEASGEAVLEAVHVEHAQIAAAALRDFVRRHAAQIADVADVFGDGEIGIETEGLREIAGVRAGFARGTAENLGRAGGGFHDAREDLKRGGFARAIGSDQAEDFAVADVEVDAAHGLERAVALPEIANANCRGLRRLAPSRSAAAGSGFGGQSLMNLPAGQVSPCTRISPSAGMPGLANPNAPLSWSFTPTTCFTRSSRK